MIALSGTVAGGPPNVKTILLTEEWTPLETGTLDPQDVRTRCWRRMRADDLERRERTGQTCCRHQKQLSHGRGANSTIAWAVTGPNLPEHSFARAIRESAPECLAYAISLWPSQLTDELDTLSREAYRHRLLEE